MLALALKVSMTTSISILVARYGPCLRRCRPCWPGALWFAPGLVTGCALGAFGSGSAGHRRGEGGSSAA